MTLPPILSLPDDAIKLIASQAHTQHMRGLANSSFISVYKIKEEIKTIFLELRAQHEKALILNPMVLVCKRWKQIFIDDLNAIKDAIVTSVGEIQSQDAESENISNCIKNSHFLSVLKVYFIFMPEALLKFRNPINVICFPVAYSSFIYSCLEKILKYEEARCSLNLLDENGNIPLYKPLVFLEHFQNDHFLKKSIELMIQNGANVDSVDSYGHTLLNIFGMKFSYKTVLYLISLGA